MDEREYWLAWAYVAGRSRCRWWYEFRGNVPDQYALDAQDAYDLGVDDFVNFGDEDINED